MAGPDDLGLIPRPIRCERTPGTLRLFESTPVLGGAGRARRLMEEYLARHAPPGAGDGQVMITEAGVEGGQAEAYRMTISTESVLIEATTEQGAVQAVNRLRQLLLDGPELPCAVIEDAPAYPWRGAHLDVARHFMPMTWVRKFVDLLALHGYNSLHLHLTDDQGWRLESERYPRLTQIGAWRERTMLTAEPETYDEHRHGGFYTKAEIRDLIHFADTRGVSIVPEIDMPGHMTAAIAAYPEFGATGGPSSVADRWGVLNGVLNVDDRTMAFVLALLDEVVELFPSPFIHVGGDEVPPGAWHGSAGARARIASEGLGGEDDIYGWFLRFIANWLRSRGRRMVGWDEVLDASLPNSAVVMSWRDETGGLRGASEGRDVVMCPARFTYFDRYQSRERDREPYAIGGHLPLERVYSFNPIPERMPMAPRRRVLGTQFQLWTEYIRTPEQAEYMAFPRACALAEVAWTPRALQDYGGFTARLATHLKRLSLLGVNYRDPALG
jgi:hexosaminidase